MSKDFLDERRSALEEAFFAQQDEALLRRMREEEARRQGRAALSAASGIGDEAVLDRLSGLGLGAGTLAALSLVPLVAVAWADGGLKEEEREAVLSAAAECGVRPGEPAREFLEGWLRAPPPPALLAAWTDYARALPPASREALRATLLPRARRVAEAAGGFLGLARRVSAEESAVLARMESALAD